MNEDLKRIQTIKSQGKDRYRRQTTDFYDYRGQVGEIRRDAFADGFLAGWLAAEQAVGHQIKEAKD